MSAEPTNARGSTVTCNLCETTFPVADGELFDRDGHTIVRCPGCDLIFRSTLPTQAELGEIYGRDYFGGAGSRPRPDGYLDYIADADAHRANARRRLGRLSGLMEPEALLDVGCAAGFFVDEAGRAGWSARGVDVSAAMVDWGRRNLSVDIRVGTLRDVPTDRLESCVTMWDYIEHALDPRDDVAAVHGRLRPGGILALSTGDAGSALARASLERWHLMTPCHHNFFFTRETITRLLEAAGFEILSAGHPASVFPLRYLAHKTRMRVNVGLLNAVARRLARSRLGERTLPINLWDVMTIVARRRSDAHGDRARGWQTGADLPVRRAC